VTLVFGLVNNLATAVALGLLLRAAFGWREPHAKRVRHDDERWL
jgi:hypothetical protein